MKKIDQLQIEQKPTEIKNILSCLLFNWSHLTFFCFQIDSGMIIRPGISILSIKIAADKIRMTFSLQIVVQNHSGC